jgi:hypothetical protein
MLKETGIMPNYYQEFNAQELPPRNIRNPIAAPDETDLMG